MKNMIHISIDDVITLFEDLNQNSYNNIFENRFLAMLKYFHDMYGAKFTLNCFIQNYDNSFNITELSSKYRRNFKKNKKWLQFSFHGINGNIDINKLSLSDFVNHYMKFEKEIKRIVGSKCSKTLRIHNFSLTLEQIKWLKNKRKISTLLLKEKMDADANNYSLDTENLKKIYNTGYILKEGIKYRKSDIRLEKNEKEKYEENMVIYTHEWVYYDDYEKNYEKLKQICSYAKENNYKFITKI